MKEYLKDFVGLVLFFLFIMMVALVFEGCGPRQCDTVVGEMCFSNYQGYVSESLLKKVAVVPHILAEQTNTSFDKLMNDHPFTVEFKDIDPARGEAAYYDCDSSTLVLNIYPMDTEKQRCYAAATGIGHEWLHHYSTYVLKHECGEDDGLKGHNVPNVFFLWAQANNKYNIDMVEYTTVTEGIKVCDLHDLHNEL